VNTKEWESRIWNLNNNKCTCIYVAQVLFFRGSGGGVGLATLFAQVCQISHWIDVSVDEMSLAWVEDEVLSSKGDHPRLSAAARHLGHPV
jgi:hypothetical protein